MYFKIYRIRINIKSDRVGILSNYNRSIAIFMQITVVISMKC